MKSLSQVLQITSAILAVGLITGCAAKINCETSPDPTQCITEEARQLFVDKYAGLIQAAISRKWIQVEGDFPERLTVEIAIVVGPGGGILNTKVLKSTGYPELDQSAVTAVLGASPLPVPPDPKYYKHYRDIEIVFVIPDR